MNSAFPENTKEILITNNDIETYIRFCRISNVIDISNNNIYKIEKTIIDNIIIDLSEFVNKLNKPNRKGEFYILISCKLENIQKFTFIINYNNVLNVWTYSIIFNSEETIKIVTKIIDEHKIQYTYLNKTNIDIERNLNEYFENTNGIIELQENRIRELWRKIISTLF